MRGLCTWGGVDSSIASLVRGSTVNSDTVGGRAQGWSLVGRPAAEDAGGCRWDNPLGLESTKVLSHLGKICDPPSCKVFVGRTGVSPSQRLL